jgi:two-component system, OmpR family, sensor kinase
VRVRLAVWHAVVLATVLSLFAVGTYLHLRRSALQRTDNSLRETAATFIGFWTRELAEEGVTPTAAAKEAAQEVRYPNHRILVLDRNGGLVVATGDTNAAAPHPASGGERLRASIPRELPGPAVGSVRWTTIGDESEGTRVRASRVTVGGIEFILVVMNLMAPEHETIDAFLEAMLIAIPLALLLSGIGGYLLARASLRPVAAMAERAEQISAARLDTRLPIANPHDELGDLGGVLNRLLDRLSAALAQQRQFMADASHELRTPVAALRSAADVTLARANRTSEEYTDALRVISTEGRRLSRIVNDLFLLARADAGEQPLRTEAFYLDEVVAECVRAGRALAAPRQVQVDLELQDEALLHGDETLIRRLVMNLVDNAVKFTPAGGRVSVAVTRASDQLRISVSDTGTGIPDSIRDRIFDRFVRGDVARGRHGASGDGAGLGLAIARWVAEAHGGRVALEASSPAGSTFVASLPIRPVPQAPDNAPTFRRGTQ